MDVVVLEAGATEPSIREVDRPEPTVGEALVRTVRVGIDGTDLEVLSGGHGGFPAGDDYLTLGHEVVGIVEAVRGESALTPGDAVVATVRRPPPSGPNEFFERGEPDMAPPEACIERGISGGHGFMSEYFTSPVETLIELPRDLVPYGFLVEPISISEKARELARAARSTFDWQPDTALVLGNGSLGLLTLAMLAEDFDQLYCLGRKSRPHPSIDVIESLDAIYVDSRETPVPEIPRVHEPADLVYEATGYARHAVESVHALAPNGVAALLGIPGPETVEFDLGSYHKEVVMTNKAVLGSVNATRRHFEAAVETLAQIPTAVLDGIVTEVYDYGNYAAAFDTQSDGEEAIKTALAFSSP